MKSVSPQKGRDGAAGSARKELVRDELLSRAAVLFERHGFANTRLQDIAEELGLRRSSLYHYFRNKEDFLAALVETEATTAAESLQQLVADESLSHRERLRRAVLAVIDRKLTGGARFRVLERTEMEMPPELAASFAKTRRRVLELYTLIIENGVKAGEFRPVDGRLAAFAVLGMGNWTAWWYSPTGRNTPAEIAETFADFALAALSSTGENGRRSKAGDLDDTIARLREDLGDLERIARGG